MTRGCVLEEIRSKLKKKEERGLEATVTETTETTPPRARHDLGMERSHMWVGQRAGLGVQGRSGRRWG